MTTVPGELDDGAPEATSLGARYLKLLFDRHGIARRERSTLVEKILGIGYHSAHRRVRGTYPVTLDEIEKIAAHFDDSIEDLVVASVLAAGQQAVLQVGDFRARCRVWLAPAETPKAPGQLVAHQVDQKLVVAPAGEDGSPNAVAVKSVLLEPLPVSRRRIALVDDDEAVTTDVGEYLRAFGFEVDTFNSAGDFREALARRPYEAYVLDWLLDGTTGRELIELIRARDKDCPIAVLTGEIQTGRASASDLADAQAEHDVVPFTKPVPTQLIAATLARQLDARPRT